MRLLAAIEPDQLKAGAVAVIVVLVVLAFLVMRFIQKLVLKLVLVVALLGAGFFLYTQRDDLDECQRHVRAAPTIADVTNPDERCTCDFAGYAVKVPGCEALLPRPGG